MAGAKLRVRPRGGRRRIAASFLGLVALGAAAPGGAFELRSPLACEIGSECFVFHHVDRDPGPGHEDHRCGPLTYDGHKGVDVALPTLAAMRSGVDVLAAAPGVVRATRDGMPDISRTDPAGPSVERRECGNGVIIEHEGGWTTQYCHMKRGSIAVSPGVPVEAGRRLGSVGLSGDTEFPHLHLSVRRDGEVIDPFDARPMGAGCETAASRGLWASGSGISYAEGGAISAGILDRVPDYAAVKASAPGVAALPASAPAIIHWAHFFGLRRGDVIASRLTGPGGAVLAEEAHVMPKTRIRQFRAIGRRRPAAGWPAGTYRGVSRLTRDGGVVDRVETSVRVAAP